MFQIVFVVLMMLPMIVMFTIVMVVIPAAGAGHPQGSDKQGSHEEAAHDSKRRFIQASHDPNAFLPSQGWQN